MAASTLGSKSTARPNRSPKPISHRVRESLTSTIGSKFLVALTGLALTGFVYVHMAGNLLVFRGRDALNDYAQFLKDLGWMLWAARFGLLAVFILHLTLALRLKRRNLAARPERYVKEATVQASWASRHMVLTGLVILAFVIFHLLHFTFGVVQSAADASGQRVPFLSLHDAQGRHDVYGMVIYGFRSPVMVVAYVIAQIILGLHLSHGIASVFQTMGWTRPTLWPLIRALGVTLAAIVVIGNIAMPLAVYFRFIGVEYAP